MVAFRPVTSAPLRLRNVPGIPASWTLLFTLLKGGEGCRLQVANKTCMRLNIVNHAYSEGNIGRSCELTIASRVGSTAQALRVPGEAAAARAELGGQRGARARQLAVQQHLLRDRRRRVAQRCTTAQPVSLTPHMHAAACSPAGKHSQAPSRPASQISAARCSHCSDTQRPGHRGHEMYMYATPSVYHTVRQAGGP